MATGYLRDDARQGRDLGGGGSSPQGLNDWLSERLAGACIAPGINAPNTSMRGHGAAPFLLRVLSRPRGAAEPGAQPGGQETVINSPHTSRMGMSCKSPKCPKAVVREGPLLAELSHTSVGPTAVIAVLSGPSALRLLQG